MFYKCLKKFYNKNTRGNGASYLKQNLLVQSKNKQKKEREITRMTGLTQSNASSFRKREKLLQK